MKYDTTVYLVYKEVLGGTCSAVSLFKDIDNAKRACETLNVTTNGVYCIVTGLAQNMLFEEGKSINLSWGYNPWLGRYGHSMFVYIEEAAT